MAVNAVPGSLDLAFVISIRLSTARLSKCASFNSYSAQLSLDK